MNEIRITDWLMVIATLSYTIATIFILKANTAAVRTTQKQIDEMKREYDNENRPYITTEIVYLRKVFYCLRFTNQGRKLADHVQIRIDENFIKQTKNEHFIPLLESSNKRECIIGVGNHYDLFFGDNSIRDIKNLKLFGNVIYSDSDGNEFQEKFNIDFDTYATFFSVNTDFDDLLVNAKEQEKELNNISNNLYSISKELNKK